MAAGDGYFGFRAVLVFVNDGAVVQVAFDHWHLQHPAGFQAHGQEWAVGGPPLLAQRRQDDVDNLVVVLKHAEQGGIEAAAFITFRRAQEFIVEAEFVQERAQPGVVVVAKTFVGPERIGNRRQRFAQVLAEHFGVGQVVRHFAKSVQVVGKGEQLGRDV